MYRFPQPAGKPLHNFILCCSPVVPLGVSSTPGLVSLFLTVEPVILVHQFLSHIQLYFLIKLNEMLYVWMYLLQSNSECFHV